MKLNFVAVLLISVLLGGCSMVPRLKRPALPVADHWHEPSPKLTEAGELSAATIGWRDFFPSQPLQSLLETTLENNRDLRIASLNIEAARALYRIQRAGSFPEVSGNLNGLRQRTTKAQNQATQTHDTVSEYNANLASTSFELDLFGRLRSQNEAALETYFATRAAKDSVQIMLIAEVANTYLQWLADRKALQLTQATQATQEKSLDLIRLRFEKGIASKLDLAQVRTALETAKAAHIRFTRRVMQDQNALRLLLGAKPGFEWPASQTLDEIQVMERLPVGLPSEILLLRPDVRQAEHELKAANADIGAARAAFFPRISLTGSLGFASNELSQLFSGAAAGAWRFVPQITMPLFQSGRLKANLAFSEAQKEIAVARYEKAIQTAFREVADQLAARNTLDRELEAQTRQVAAAQETYDLSNARYQAGIDSYLVALDAQRFLFDAQQRQIEIEKQRLANLVNLYKTLGGGLLASSAGQAMTPGP